MRVLVVEDNPDGGAVLVLLLEVLGHDVRLAADGPAGLRAAAEFSPDCCILDIGLPGIDGYALAPLIRALPGLSSVLLVAHSAYAGPDHERRLAEAGFDRHLTKPADPADFDAAVRSARRRPTPSA